MRFFILYICLLTGLTACQSLTSNQDRSSVTLYPARQILTMEAHPVHASMIAVSEGRIIAIGSENRLKRDFKSAHINPVFADKVILPGLIDPHVHMILGAMMYGLKFIPPWDVPTANKLIKGLKNKAELLARIRQIDTQSSDKHNPLILYGYHNLVHGSLTRQDLDAITTLRPLIIWHYSGHDFYLNTSAITYLQLHPEMAKNFHGIDLDTQGALTGRIYEDAALLLFDKLAALLLTPEHIERGFEAFETLLAHSGVTTVAEMGYGIFGRALEDKYIATHYSTDDSYQLFLIPEHRAFSREFGKQSAEKIRQMSQDQTTPAPVLRQIKLFTDAAFYSQTMKLTAPGYIGGQSKGTDGLWVTPPEQLSAIMRPYWEKGLDIHIHSNGDSAQWATLQAFRSLAPAHMPKQRLIIEHAGLLTPEQIDQAAEYNIGLSAASHYVYYMANIYAQAIGEKTHYITPLASALKAGLPSTLHSDAPLAPPQPLRAASVHITRATREGQTHIPSERLTPLQALQAITLNAAWSLGLEDEIGSLKTGKRADFTILEANPLTTHAGDWPDIPVWGVVRGGVLYPLDK